jgi:hypothetical protein
VAARRFLLSTTAALVVIAGQEGPVGTYDPDTMTCREPQRPDDQTARQLVRLWRPDIDICLHDDGTQDMLYDLELRWPDGHVGAMEVTCATSATLRHVTFQLDRQGPVIATEATRNWDVHLAADTTDVALVRSKIDYVLSLAEQAGLTRLRTGRFEAGRSAAVARIRELGVDSGWSSECVSGQPRIRLHLPVRWWRQQPELVNKVVEDHAQRNARKLARSGCHERHLFVLFDLGEMEAWSVIRDGEPPEAPPQLPEAVTTAWAASNRADGSPVVWRVHRAGLWEVLL